MNSSTHLDSISEVVRVKRINKRNRKGKAITFINDSSYKVIEFTGINLCDYVHSYKEDIVIQERLKWFCRILKNSYREGSHDYRYFSVKELELILGIHFRKIIEECIHSNLLFENKLETKYKNQNTYAYRLSDSLLSIPTKRVPIVIKKVMKSMKKHQEKYRFINITNKKLREIIIENYNRAYIPLSIAIDEQKADFINNEKEDHKFLMDKYGNRTHSLFTRMKKVERLTIRDIKEIMELVIEGDIVNSQPFFLLLIIIAQNYLKEIVPKEVVHRVSFLKEVINTEDFARYMKDVMNGTIYESYVQCLDEQLENWYNPTKDKRKQAKKLFYRIVFSSTKKRSKIAKEAQILFDMYPSLFEAVNQLKSIDLYQYFRETSKKPYKPHKNITILLQRIESYVTDLIYIRLHEEKVWSLKCHDSFAFKCNQLEVFNYVVKDVFKILDLPSPTLGYKVKDSDKIFELSPQELEQWLNLHDKEVDFTCNILN